MLTNPVFKTSMSSGLSSKGKAQVCPCSAPFMLPQADSQEFANANAASVLLDWFCHAAKLAPNSRYRMGIVPRAVCCAGHQGDNAKPKGPRCLPGELLAVAKHHTGKPAWSHMSAL